MNCIGIDLHTDNFTVARRRLVKNKAVKTTSKYNLDDKSMNEFIKTLSKDDYIAIEATVNSFWFHDKLKDYVKEVIVFNTNKINFEGNKTDKIDAKKILEALEYYVFIKCESEIPKVYVPEIHIRELRELFSTYRLQKKIITQIKNRIHSIFKQHGLKIKRTILDSNKGKESVRNTSVNKVSDFQIKILIRQLEEAELEHKEITELIMNIGNKYFRLEIDLLITIPGFSALTAIALLTDIADIKRFSNVKKFCSYLRTAPKVKGSNRTTHLGKINKSSRTLSLSLLTQSIKHFRNSASYFDDFYTRLKAGKSYGKTRIALIRKILVCAYHMLKRNEAFKWSNKSNIKRKTQEFLCKANKGEINLRKYAFSS